jgi:galactokinase
MTGAGLGGSVIALSPAASAAAVSSAVMAALDRTGLAGASDTGVQPSRGAARLT